MEPLCGESLLRVLLSGAYHWSLADLAREVGISRSHLSRILSGGRQPSLPVARRMAQALGMSLDEIESYRNNFGS